MLKKDVKLTWKLLNEVINKQTRKPSLPSSFKFEGKPITNPKVIADSFCKYFTYIGPNLASAIPAANSNFRSFLDNNNNPFTLKPTTTVELENISLASGIAPGRDNVPMHGFQKFFSLNFITFSKYY